MVELQASFMAMVDQWIEQDRMLRELQIAYKSESSKAVSQKKKCQELEEYQEKQILVPCKNNNKEMKHLKRSHQLAMEGMVDAQ